MKFSFTRHKMINSTKFSPFCEIQHSWQRCDEFDKKLSILSNSAFLVIKWWIWWVKLCFTVILSLTRHKILNLTKIGGSCQIQLFCCKKVNLTTKIFRILQIQHSWPENSEFDKISSSFSNSTLSWYIILTWDNFQNFFFLPK